MSFETLWQTYRQRGYPAVCSMELISALDHFYLALLAFGQNDLPQALQSAQSAVAQQPNSPVLQHSVTYLNRVASQGKTGVYISGDAFSAFIRGGGNVQLYQAINDALRRIYQEYETLTIFDVGVGDGLALLPALTSNITRLDILEPSEAMLTHTAAELKHWNINFHAYQNTIQQFIQSGTETWDVIQATWSLQSIHPDERPAIFEWAHQHGKRLLVAEFDVPNYTELYEPARVEFILTRYEKGLTEYADDGGLVAQGFLMPVMFGYFDQSASRTNYEGPIESWVNTIQAAGFRDIRVEPLYAYWWANSLLIDARI